MIKQYKNIKFYEIKDFPYYYVSKCGKVFSSYITGTLSQKITKNGYCEVNLSQGKKHISKYIHRLVAQTFIPNPSNKRTVNHIDGNKANNRIENLEWNTYSENHKHAYTKLKRIGSNTGNYNERNPNYGNRDDKNPLSKKVGQYDLNGNLIKTWHSAKEISRQLGFNACIISNVCTGRQHTGKGFIWRYI